MGPILLSSLPSAVTLAATSVTAPVATATDAEESGSSALDYCGDTALTAS
jgi:hypothetical protein